MKKTVRIKYCDFPKVDENNFFITRAMRKFCNPVISDDPEILFYSCYSGEHLKYNNIVKVFFSGENVHPDFNECDYAIACQPIVYGNRFFQLSGHNWHMDSTANDRERIQLQQKRRFCNFIYSSANLRREGVRKRIEFCKLLSTYKRVDCPGRVLHNMDAPELSARNSNEWALSKTKFIQKYKFTIAWENTFGEGYTTEKLAEPLMAGSVPIYWGYVPCYINPKSIINVSDFSSMKELVKYIEYLDNNEEAYREILFSQPLLPNYRFHWEDELSHFLKQIVDSNFAQRAKDPVGYASTLITLQTRNNSSNLILRALRFCKRALNRRP